MFLRVVWRCGLTNRSTAVADAELLPPMVPVVNSGPSFGSILATSRDFRFSSFKKADVDMCQGFLLTVEPPIIANNIAQINPSFIRSLEAIPNI